MLTPEREAEIREKKAWLTYDATRLDVRDLLAEIDRLRAALAAAEERAEQWHDASTELADQVLAAEERAERAEAEVAGDKASAAGGALPRLNQVDPPAEDIIAGVPVKRLYKPVEGE